ncbi:MAG TPA: tetratricopeptide repeat protein [Polyangia bacterium]|nr:tetratricopeptide repeat protein [Polyangia bacterium]
MGTRAAVVLLLLSGAPAHAQAPDDVRRARQLSDEGLAQFNRGHYRQAIEAFEASFALRRLPVLLFDIAQAYRLDGDCDRALEHYRRYVREAPDAANRTLVDGFIAEMERCARPPEPSVTAPPPAVIEAAPPAVTEAPPAPIAPPPATAPSPAPSARPELVAPPSSAPARRPLYKQWWLWTAVGVVVVAAGVGLGVGLSSGGPPAPSLGSVAWKP